MKNKAEVFTLLYANYLLSKYNILLKNTLIIKEEKIEYLYILQKEGIDLEVLAKLSYKTNLNRSLKRNIHYFCKEAIIKELNEVYKWYSTIDIFQSDTIDYRIKGIQSSMIKYNKYYPQMPVYKIFNDLLGFRILCNNYGEILKLKDTPYLRVVDLSNGKSEEDGYRGVHLYFQLDNLHYPIEIQYITYRDKQMNSWLHKYVYKKEYHSNVGAMLRKAFDNGKITNEKEFKEVLSNVLFNSEKN